MDGKREPREPILIPPKGVVAHLSTDILAVPDLKVARAVRFIWEHHHEAIGTPEIAVAAGLNRRKLDVTFEDALDAAWGRNCFSAESNTPKSC